MTDKIVEILLIEDNARDEELTIRALRKQNITNEIHVARDGAQAIDYIFGGGKPSMSTDGVPKLILLDLKLPKVSGLEILKRLKSDPKTKVIPVVVLTSSREESDLIESYKLGVNGYVVKPVDFAQFSEAVRQLGLYWMLINEAPLPAIRHV